MINIKINKKKGKVGVEGIADDLIAEMCIAIKMVNEHLRESDEEVAKTFQKTLIECQPIIFGYDQTEEVYKEMREEQGD